MAVRDGMGAAGVRGLLSGGLTRPPTRRRACGAGKLTRGAVSAELLQPAELVSGAICQVAADPELAGLLSNFLYSNEGALLAPAPPVAMAEICTMFSSYFILSDIILFLSSF